MGNVRTREKQYVVLLLALKRTMQYWECVDSDGAFAFICISYCSRELTGNERDNEI
jgi:hypothetical protein